MERRKPQLASKTDCTGCQACGDICPKGCISFEQGKDGLLYPRIDNKDCIGCRSCERACPIITPVLNDKKLPKVYAAWANKEIRSNSASGGVFYELAFHVIEEDGYVSGAVFDGYKVKHVLTNKVSDLYRLQGTKYFQSETSGIYKSIRSLLKEGKTVLFSGTSCQVAGLLNVVGEYRENLIAVDLICYGVPSALTVSVEERMRGKKLKSIISCRDKKHEGGWRNAYYMTCEWEDGTTTVSDPKQSFMLGSFCSGKVMRNSCYCCPFKTISRQSDLTLGDYHCIKDFEEEKADGISLVYVHTEKGLKLLQGNVALTIHERDIKEALPYKRTIYYNDGMYAKRLTRRWMPFLLKYAPNWMLNILYKDVVRSKNPLVWPQTAIDAFYLLFNNKKAKKKLESIKI